MFDNLEIVIDSNNIDIVDLIIDEIMKVAVARY
jgi:type I restriction enzyme R subunit